MTQNTTFNAASPHTVARSNLPGLPSGKQYLVALDCMVSITGCLHASDSGVEIIWSRSLLPLEGRRCRLENAAAYTRLRPRRHRISAGFRSRPGFGFIIGSFMIWRERFKTWFQVLGRFLAPICHFASVFIAFCLFWIRALIQPGDTHSRCIISDYLWFH